MVHDRLRTGEESEGSLDRPIEPSVSIELLSADTKSPEPNFTSGDKVEITHNQLSRGAALIVLLAFLIFLLGYTLGKQSSEQASEFMPSLYTTFFGGTLIKGVLTEEKKVLKEYGRFATEQEADKLYSNLVKQGKKIDIIKRISSTASGKEYTWYQVGKQELQDA